MNLDLSDFQIKKLVKAYKNKIDLVIQLKHTQIGNGKNKFNLTDRQNNKLTKAKKDKKGVRLKITKSQFGNKDKVGGFLPLIIAGIGALSALAGGASAIANTVIDAKDKKLKRDETERHNKMMEENVRNIKTLQIGSSLKKNKIKNKKRNIRKTCIAKSKQ